MNINEFAQEILRGENLENKLLTPNGPMSFHGEGDLKGIMAPARSTKIKLGGQAKFPKTQSLANESERARALHFFANHELLAIELMSYFILSLKEDSEESRVLKRRIFETIKDEQKHLSLYVNRINQMGVEFGDFPLNDFLWRQSQFFTSTEKYFTIMALTFETANLDFAKYYSKLFYSLGDENSSKIMATVYQDEIAHVALGVTYLNKTRGDKTLWDYYNNLLPDKLGASRSKGVVFDEEGRIKAGYPQEYVETQKNYIDPYQVINRKEWKRHENIHS